ncbi:uncharacterized protein LDX57_010290 [Aspergillus melleus]|uniref:uncharacterized protein n=1 Tax=Aspergillus melleus TaxID=138277 RepID=UPI001E8D3EF6|nr:uncharacterized protein LDX57_010290 [Aspergillus melleus]KAH8432663.1 hypothetical protein LDX57_010290 [Aspergillus melleus]
MYSPSVSVVIPPPTVNLDSYDFLERTCDEILSREASFDSSFDDYSENRMMDGSYEIVTGTVDRNRLRNDSGHARSPYFAPQNPSKKRTVSTRHIMRIDSESDDEETEEEEDEEEDKEGGREANVLDALNSAPSGRAIFKSTEEEIEASENNRFLAEMEANAFAQVDEEVQERLIRSISEHPFFRSDAYPVKRSERREFVNHMRQAAAGAGLDEDTTKNIIAYVKKLYLTSSGWGHVCESGSEYGDEIDDEPTKTKKSAKKRKKDRQRKRSNSDKSTDRRSKKTTNSANATDCQGVKSKDTKVGVHPEKTAKPVLHPASSEDQLPETASDPPSKARDMIHLDSSDSDEPALSTPTKRRNNPVNGDGSKRSRRPLLTKQRNPIIPSDSEKHARLSEVRATQRLTNEESPSQNLYSSRLDSAVSKASSKTRRRRKRRSQKTLKAPNSDILQEPRTEAQKTSQSTSTVAPKKSKPVAAAQLNIDDFDYYDLDF